MKSRESAARARILFLFLALLLAGMAAQVSAAGYPVRPHLWKFKTRGAVVASPALSADGTTLYVGSMDGRFYALDTFSGESKWTGALRLPAAITGSAVVNNDDGRIYVSCQNNQIYAITDLEDHGQIEWSYATPGKHAEAPALAEDGTVYFGSTDNHLWALTPERALKWAYTASNNVATPVVGSDGTVYVAAGGYVRGVSKGNGSETSRFTPSADIRTIPAIGVADVLYFGAKNGKVYALDTGASTNGGVLWSFDTGKDISVSSAIGADGQVYVAAQNSQFYCLSLSGRVRWSLTTPTPILSALSIGADGTVYGGAGDGRLYAISPSPVAPGSGRGKVLWTVKTRGAVHSSPAIDAYGIVYFGSSDSYIYAVDTETFSDSGEVAWQMFRKDAQHTARATECQPYLIRDVHVDGGVDDGATSLSITNRAAIGRKVNLAVTIRAGASVVYQWQLNGTNIADNASATSAKYVITNASFSDSGDYSVLVSNDCGELESGTFTLKVQSLPVITSQPTNQLLLAGGLLALKVQAVGDVPLVYQWRQNGTNVGGATTNADYFLTNALPADAGIYSVIVTNNFGVVTSTEVRVTIYPNTLTLAARALAAGPRHSLAVRADGTLWTWGLNNFGQVGDGTVSSSGANLIFRDLPRLLGTNGTVTTNAVWSSVAGGSRGADPLSGQPGGFSLGLQTNGTLWAWGLNDLGQLGLGLAGSPQRLPVRIGLDTNWVQAEAGATHVVALQRDGSLWTWGGNAAGQLGLGTSVNSSSPVRVGTDSAWVEVRAGGSYSLARRADGTIWAWGGNTNAQLGLGHRTSQRTPVQIGTSTNWAALSAGVVHSLALRTDGTLWSWGRNNYGQLGTGGATNSTRPVRVGNHNDWQVMEAGFGHSLAIKTNGALFAWGANWFGQLGNGTNGWKSNTNGANQRLPVAIATNLAWQAIDASSHSLGLALDGSVWAWGWNGHGQIGGGTGGDGSSTYNSNAPVQLTFDSDVRGPGFSLQPSNVIVVESNAASFSVNFTGAPQVFLQWYRNSNAISASVNPTATNTTLSIPEALRTNVGFYHVVATNHFGAATSIVASLSVSNLEGIVYLPGGGTTNLNAPRLLESPVSQIAQLSNTVSFSVMATGAPTLVYRWFFNSNGIDAVANPSALSNVLTLTNVLSARAGFYHATVTNLLGGTTSLVASLTLTNTSGLVFLPNGGTTNFLAPGILEQPTNQMVLESNAVAFSVTVTGAPPFFYRWYFNGDSIPEIQNASTFNPTFSLPNAAGTEAGFYFVVVTNTFGRSTSLVVSLTVSNENGTVHLPNGTVTNYLIPRLTSQPVSQSVQESNHATFSLSVTGVPPFSLQWFFNSNVIAVEEFSTATNIFLSVTNAQATNAGFYQAVITNLFGSATSGLASLTVTNLNGTVYLPDGGVTNYSVPRILTQPVSLAALTNSTVNFSVLATGAAPLRFLWRQDSNVIAVLLNPTATNATLVLSNVTPVHAGFYDVLVSNAFGLVVSVPVELAVTNGAADLSPVKSREVRLGVVTLGETGVLLPVLGTATGRTLVLEFKTRLSDPDWTPLSTNAGNVSLLFDSSGPPHRSRFYRLRVE